MCIASLGLVGCTPQSFVHRKWGFIDKTGKLVIPYRFDDVDLDTYGGFEDPNLGHFLPKPFGNFREGLCAVRVDDHWGYIDKTGRLVIPPQYDEAGAFSEGLAFVRKSRQCGYVDRTGKLVIKLGLPPWMSDTPSTLSESESSEPESSKSDWIRTKALQVFEFSDGLAVAYSGQKCGYINKTGDFVIEPKYVRCEPLREGMMIVSKNLGDLAMDCIDRTGTVIATVPAPGLVTCGNGLCLRRIGQGRSEYIDIRTGKRAVPREFRTANPFSEGLAAATSDEDGTWGYIDASGKFVIPPSFYVSGNNTASAFVDGRAIVEHLSHGNGQDLQCVIDRTGKLITPFIYEGISAYRDGLAGAHRNNAWVFLNRSGNEVINCQAAWANSFSDGLAAVQQP